MCSFVLLSLQAGLGPQTGPLQQNSGRRRLRSRAYKTTGFRAGPQNMSHISNEI